MNEKIKNWYLKNFSSDDLGEYIKENITFAGLFDCLDNYKCVYEFLGVDDNIEAYNSNEFMEGFLNSNEYYFYENGGLWLGA